MGYDPKVMSAVIVNVLVLSSYWMFSVSFVIIIEQIF